MDNILRCQICNKTDNKGIILLNEYICRACELNLLNPGLDQLNYERARRSIKRLWKGVVLGSTVENF